MMKFKQYIKLIIILLFIISCKSNNNEKRNQLLDVINSYINSSELKAIKSELRDEYNIYLVIFKSDEDSCYVDILENSYYIREGLEGHMKIKENLVAFYGFETSCNHGYIDVKDLNTSEIVDYFHEDSYEVQEFTLDTWVVTYKIDNGKLIMQ